ncbi:MAG: DUF1573 domain-containing protein [Ignavibacteriaceae bacterium]|jgi:Protein of unknown function (DUF1573).|nr:MAG: DUF1573 domain-containing protein [Chlorobiota bacterium]KXK06486.1 MAG: hypothetical protein UZ04_CHB001000491 [Chlorobi bacterium OLB4]MBV6399700.1 hypothetical protein [Ignavibacteria bacterium]MCC6885216.1 DUF1573 domain-containing protein [Ignavibacteriales bacterium]MCE7953381.1 DUF1573 domain-containing protein [Chlorobi bacterium CHB7]MDL1887203.1 DUF1573 domain-containing protein [Ignavibacteria bacterium CHB1]MEB2330536.1 DUF1573 domain-containing protein [Ignavibacteriaceae
MNKIPTRGKSFTFIGVGIVIISAIMFVVFTNSQITASLSSDSPKIVFTNTTFDFGTVPQGPEVSHSFEFKNSGSGTLKIEKITSSCGCTGATSGDKDTFTKDETGEIKVTFKTQGREGKQEKTVLVFTNDPANPQQVLKITCNIDPSM